MSTTRRQIPPGQALVLFCLLQLSAALFAMPPAAASRVRFDVPAGDAGATLRLFSQQSGQQLIFPAEVVRGHATRPVRGELAPRDALERMLAGSGLCVMEDASSGALVVTTVGKPGGKPPSVANGRAVGVRAAPLATAGAPNGENPADDIVVLTPFEVRSRTDVGYRAANSVTATRMAVPLHRLPMAVTAFTEAFIADQKAYDLYDIVKWAPGVHQDNISPQGWVRYNIRGFTSAAVQRNGFGSFRFIDTTNIERVEVVKGPASLLFGQINPGGVINYITKRPSGRAGYELSAAAGSHGYRRVVADATGPVPGTGGRLLYRIIGMAEELQAFRAESGGRKHLLAPSVTWKLTERATLRLEYEHFARLDDMPTGGVVLAYHHTASGLPFPGAPYPGLPKDFSYAGRGDYQDFVADAFTAELTASFGEHLTVRASYLDSYWDMDWRATGQGGTGLLAQAYIDHYYPPSARLTSADAMYRRNRWEHQWGGERTVQLDAVLEREFNGSKLRALVGAKRNLDTRLGAVQRNNPNVAGSPYYLKPWDLRDPSTWDRSVPFGRDVLLPAAHTESASDATSAYAVVSATTWRERLHLLAGYARHELRNHATHDRLARTVTPASRRAAGIPQAGLLMSVAPGVAAYLSYSESFLANATLLRVNNVPTRPAAPSIGRGWDVGLKFATPDHKLTGTLSLYRIQASPTGVVTVTSGLDPNGTTLFTDVQGGSQRSEGMELDLIFAPTDELQLIAGFGRCDAVYTHHPTDPRFNGSPLVATPKQTLSLWAKYVGTRGALANFVFAGGANYVGSMSLTANNPFVRTGPYITCDLTLGRRFRAWNRRWNVDLSVKNVFDEAYYASASSWGLPRYFILSVGTRW